MLTDEIGGLEEAREALARERLEELQALARTYRNWSVKELALALGRQPGRLVPDSGMPKIDLVVGLAKALDWPVEAVVDHLMKPASNGRKPEVVHDSAADYARPEIGRLMDQWLIGPNIKAQDRLALGFPTAGVAVIAFDSRDWHLRPHSGRIERFISPKTVSGATD